MTPFSELFFIAIIVQEILHGIYIVTLLYCLRWLIYDEGWGRREEINWTMLIISMVVFLLSTIDLGIRFWAVLGPAMTANTPTLLDMDGAASGAIEDVVLLIVNAILIFRCWVIYAKSWFVIGLPLLLWFTFLLSSILSTYYSVILGRARTIKSAFWVEAQSFRFIILLFASDIATNLYTTSAIIYRILRVAKGNYASGSSARLLNVCRILAESGAIYTLSSVIALIATVLLNGATLKFDLNLFRTVSAAVNFVMAGIAFNIILIRAHQNRTNPRDGNVSSRGQTISN